MLFRFQRPVYSGDTVRCEVRVERAAEEGEKVLLELSFVMRNQGGKDVLTGEVRGMVRK